MSGWRGESTFASFIDANPGYFSPTAMTHPTRLVDDQALFEAIEALQRLSARSSNNRPLVQRLKEILDFTKSVPTYSATMQSEQIFVKLEPLRAWLFWMPISLMALDSVRESNLVLLAQIYAVAVAVDASLPELRRAALGSLTKRPSQYIERQLRNRQFQATAGLNDLDPSIIDEAMQFPHSMLEKVLLDTMATSDAKQVQVQGRQSPYGFQHLAIASSPSTPAFLPGTPRGIPLGFGSSYPTMPNQSTEDLSAPASPFLRYGTPASRRHSQLADVSPRVSEASTDNRSLSSYSFRGDSPAYSPAYHEEDPLFRFRAHSPPSFQGECVTPTLWA